LIGKIAGEDFVKLITDELSAMSAFTTGKLKVEGDLMKSQLIEKLFRSYSATGGPSMKA